MKENKTYHPFTRVIKNWNGRLTAVTIDTDGSEAAPNRISSRYQQWDAAAHRWIEQYDTAEFGTRGEAVAYGKGQVERLRSDLLRCRLSR
tara:strand:- start:618 stop:887 length:270 start_codon:yes stop_codon:yes gene_type:complete